MKIRTALTAAGAITAAIAAALIGAAEGVTQSAWNLPGGYR